MAEESLYNNYTDSSSNSSQQAMLASVFAKMLAGNHFIEPVQVKAIEGEAPNLTVDVLPLLNHVDSAGNPVETSPIYGVPVWRLQGGGNAIVVNPVVGDIGFIAVCDRDINLIKANRKSSIPQTMRRHNKSDAIYLGGFLNSAPTQYVQIDDNGVTVKSTSAVKIQSASDVNINGLKISPSGTLTLVDGSVVDKHVHGGVESGSSSTQPLGS